MADVTPLESEVAGLIVETLDLKIEPARIEPEAPLFGTGLGLDSIDALELSLAISRAYGYRLRSDDPHITETFRRSGRCVAPSRAVVPSEAHGYP